MLPVLTTFKNAMNSRKAILRPTITIKVVPVADCGCCSAVARAMNHPPGRTHSGRRYRASLSGDRRGRLFFRRHVFWFQFLLNLFHDLLESLFEGVAVPVRRSAHPQG